MFLEFHSKLHSHLEYLVNGFPFINFFTRNMFLFTEILRIIDELKKFKKAIKFIIYVGLQPTQSIH